MPPGALLGNGRLPKPDEKLSKSSGLVITVATDADAEVDRPASFAPLSESNPEDWEGLGRTWNVFKRAKKQNNLP